MADVIPAFALVFGRRWTAVHQATADGWAFDPVSFAIGLVTALVLIALVYRNRAKIAHTQQLVRERAFRLRQRFTATMATRYSVNVIETAQTRHLFPTLAPFDSIYSETLLYAPLLANEDVGERLTLTPTQAIATSDRLAVIGPPGCGRTTMLNHILLHQARKVREVGERKRVPMYVYLPILAGALKDDAAADEIDDVGEPRAELLVRTALSSMSRVVASGVARWLRRQVETGNSLVLLDGWDEVPPADRMAVTAWIKTYSATYPGSQLLVTAGKHGYGPLAEAGFAPLALMPWSHRQFSVLADKWLKAWPANDSEKEESLFAISYTLRPPTPFEATIELVIRLRGLTPAGNPARRMAQVMDLLVPPPEADDKDQIAWPLETGHQALGHLALVAFEQGRLTVDREQIQSSVTDFMPRPRTIPDADLVDDAAELEMSREEQERRTLQIVDCCRALTATGAPIRTWDTQRYYYVHPLLAAYLAARHAAIKEISVVSHVDDPTWLPVLQYYAGFAPAESLIDGILARPDDIFMNQLWSAADLLATLSTDDAPWRKKLVTRLAQLFVNPRLPAPLRDRTVTALVYCGEAGIEVLFKKTADHPHADVRAGSVLGLGGLGRDDAIHLIEDALGDEDLKVRLAAIHALSILAQKGSDKALELIIASIIEAADEVQRVAAEALADLGSDGETVLREAAKDQDLMVRRAAVYGLAAVNENWANGLLDQMQREDDQWLVRNAASEALASVDRGWQADVPLDLALPKAESESWLVAWAADRGEGTGVGDAAVATLLRALMLGDLNVRLTALDTLRRLGDPQTIDSLRQTLRDPEPVVRDSALLALEEISRRHDITILRG